MSLLIGQGGSQTRHEYVVPSTAPSNFLEHPAGVEDRSRFRSQAYVQPRNIQLMQGTFTLPGANDIPTPKPLVKSVHGWYMSS